MKPFDELHIEPYPNRWNGKPHIWPYYSKNYQCIRFMCGVNNGTASLGDTAREAYLNWEKRNASD